MIKSNSHADYCSTHKSYVNQNLKLSSGIDEQEQEKNKGSISVQEWNDYTTFAGSNQHLIPSGIKSDHIKTDSSNYRDFPEIPPLSVSLDALYADYEASEAQNLSASPETSDKTIINQEYIGDELGLAISRAVHATMCDSLQGTGKSWAMRMAIKKHAEMLGVAPSSVPVMIIAPLKAINETMSTDGSLEGFSFYEDIKKLIKDKADPDTICSKIRRMAVTPQSNSDLQLFYFKHTGEWLVYELVFLDEIAATSKMITSSATEDKVRSLGTLIDVCRRANKITGLDAFPSAGSDNLLKLLSRTGEYDTLENKFLRWDMITAKIIVKDKSTYSDRVDGLTRQVRRAIKAGKKIALTSSSATYCEDLYQTIKDKYKNVILIGTASTPEKTALMNNPSLVKNYIAVIYTPAIGSGVSFDIFNHIDIVFAAFVNVSGTGGTSDAVQQLARFRHIASCEWVIVLDNDKQIFSKERELIGNEEIFDIIIKKAKQELFGAGSTTTVSDIELSVVKQYAINDDEWIKDKNNYNSNLKSKLSKMGVTVKYIQLDSIPEDEAATDEMKQTKADRVEADKDDKTKSERIDERRYNNIGKRLKYDKDSVTPAEIASRKRYRFERDYIINCDNASPAEIKEALELDASSAISQIVNREIATCADTVFNNRLMKARVIGIGDNEAFKVDLLDAKRNYKIKAKLLAYVVPFLDGQSYSHKDLVNSGLYHFIKRHEKEIRVFELIPLASNWSKKPALIMNHLMGMVGYKPTIEQKRVGGKRLTSWRGISIKPIDRLINERLKSGENWVYKTTSLMDIYEDVKDFLTPEMIEELQMPRVDINFAHKIIMAIPSNFRAEILKEYAFRYDMMNPLNKCGVHAPESANAWLSIQADNLSIDALDLQA